MNKYDAAFDAQVEWSSFWASNEGLRLFGALRDGMQERRKASGERFTEYAKDESMAVMLLSLANADCYYWEPQMLGVVEVAAQSLPDNWKLLEEYLPSKSGFFYLSRPIFGTICGIAWSMIRVEEPRADIPLHLTTMPLPGNGGTGVVCNAIALTIFDAMPSNVMRAPMPTPDTMYLRDSLGDWKMRALKMANQLNAPISAFEQNFEAVRVFAAMLAFLQQRILIHSRYNPSRAALRRAKHYKFVQVPEIKVIKLRSVEYTGAQESEHQDVDWQCRWVVRGHWRNQWYPSIEANQPVYINPYIKGPEDKPLINPKKLFDVAR